MVRVFLTLFTLAAVGGLAAVGFDYVQGLRRAEFSDANLRPVFVEIAPITAAIIDHDSVVGAETFEISLETRAGGPHHLLVAQRDRVQAMFITYFAAFAQRPGAEGLRDVNYVRAQLKTACGELLGPEIVRDVWFRGISSRPAG